MRQLLAVTAIAVLCAPALPVQTQDQFERQVRRQLEEIGSELRKKGYEPTHQVFVGRLKDGQTETVTFRLRRDTTYTVAGVCDQDCKDLNLRLFDPAKRENGRDVQKDEVPVVEFRSDKTGDYDVRIEMAECNDEPCTYGIGIFGTDIHDFERQVRQQLEAALVKLGQQGFTLTDEIFTGALKQADTEDVTVNLQRGTRQLIVGVCDNDCKDLDLVLLDNGGR